MKKIVIVLMMMVICAGASQLKQLEYLGSVKDIIISTQKIRGGTYNFLNGSEFAQFGVYEERSVQKSAFMALDKQFTTGGKKLDMAYDKLRNQTKSLNKLAFELDPLTAFKAYSTLINKMIETNKLGRYAFFDKSSLMIKNTTLLMVDELLPLSEGLGKLRGLGSGIIGRGYCEEEEKKMMKGYVKEINTYLTKSINSLNALQNANPKLYPKSLTESIKKMKTDVNKYVKFANTKVIGKSDINEDSNDYFDAGTALISKVVTFYKMNEDILKVNIHKENFSTYN